MTLKKALILLVVLVLGAALTAATYWFRRDTGLTVTVEPIRTRNLEAFVSSSGTIQPKRQVNLVGCQPDALGLIHQVEHLPHDLAQFGIHPLDRFGFVTQGWMRIINDAQRGSPNTARPQPNEVFSRQPRRL